MLGGADGEEEIVDKFRQVYEALYNSAASNLEVDKIKEKLQSMIGNCSADEVLKITGDKVKEAANLMSNEL